MIGKKINQLATELAPVSTDLTIIGDPISGVSKKITLAQLGAIFSGAVSFYTNLAAFPAVGDINVIYCAKDTQKLYLWSGSAYVEVFPSQALLNTYQLRSEKGVSNGYASLDSGGKVPISQLPSSIMEYKGTWSASTNTPTLANGTGDTGDVYICNSPGSVNFGAGPITFAVGDYVIYSGSIWQRSSGAVGTVTSVGVTISGDALAITGSPITTSGTINLGFAGTSLQYINGAGNLVTFPGIISQAQNLVTEVYNKTGATLTKGTVVYISGGQGNLPSVSKALATGDATSAQTYGIVQNDITNNNNGFVVAAGRLSDLDTQAFTEGTQLYLSPTTAGTYQSTKPYAPQHLVYVAIVVRAHPTQGVIEVKIQNGYEMDELHNVAAQNPDNNDLLQYKTATSLWTKVAGTTTNIAEGTNLYYTDARARAAITLTTTGTSGSATYSGGTLNIPQYQGVLTNPITGTGTSGQVAYFNGTNSITSNAAFAFTPTSQLLVNNSVTAASAIARGTNLTPTLVAAANNDVLVGLDINPTFTNGAFTNVSNVSIRLSNVRGGLMWLGALSGNSGTGFQAYQFTTNDTSNVGTMIVSQRNAAGSGTTLFVQQLGAGLGLNVNTGNTLLGTGSDAGFKLDVNGTARVSGVLTLSSTISNGTNTYTLPNATGTLALTSQLTGGTVTSVGLSSATSGVTIGSTPITTSGTITLAIATASGSQNGLLSSTDWTTFNNKQSALTNPVTGTGTTNFLPKFTGASTIGNSIISEVSGAINVSGLLTATGGLRTTGANGYQDTDGTSTIIVNANFTSNISGIGTLTNHNLAFVTNSTIKATLTTSGNLGLGVTPSAWASPTYRAFQIGSSAALFSAAGQVLLDANSFVNTDFLDIYTTTGFATRYQQVSGQHRWYNAPSGTAGNAISFTQAMTLNASGNLSVGNTNDSFKLDVSGTIRATGNVTFNGTGFFGSDVFTYNNGGVFFSGGGAYTSGIFQNAGGLQLQSGGSSRLTIASTGAATFSSSVNANGQINGNIGVNVGTNSLGADRMLQVSGTAFTVGSNQFAIVNNPTMGTLTTAFGYYGSINVTSATTAYVMYLASLGGTITNKFGIYQDGSGDKNYFAGNVGIGTTSPVYRLDVRGQGYFATASGTNQLTLGDITNGTTSAIATSNNNLLFYPDGSTERMRITSGGNVEINTGSIKTGAPTNGTAQPWKLGDARSGIIVTNSYIIVSVNGTTYSIPALNGLP